ncbi:MAG: thiamine biosynthesis lipoprotein [Spirochaetes bacterium]|nr:MAG: thiamine biosynthesis lipoprotein [Spirochaetota bacterium]
MRSGHMMKGYSMRKISRLLVLLLVISACAPNARGEINRTDLVLGTVCTLRLVDGGSNRTADEIFKRLKAIEDTMSANKDGTQIAEINAHAGKDAVKIGADTMFVLQKALEYARKTEGALDPSIGPLVKLWNIGTDDARIPGKEEIRSTLSLIDYRKVQINPTALTVRLPLPGMKLDLGAIAKGYAADEIARILEKHRVRAAVVDLGGNVLVFGKKKDGSPWRVGVQDPSSDRGEYIGLVAGEAMTVVTSGIYERFFIEDGVRYHHLLDPKTGFPAKNNLVSVTIIASSSIDADALSTSAFILGLEKGMKLVEGIPDVGAVFIDLEKRVYLSSRAKKIFTLTNKGYTMAE